jgi:ribonuclease HI
MLMPAKDKIHRHRLAPRFRDIVFSSPIFSVNRKGPKVQQTQDGKKPIHNFLKINFYASFSEQTFSGGCGFVITNKIGEVVAAAAGHIENVSNPLQAEAMTCYEALTFAAEQGMVALEVETDCLQLKQALLTRDLDAAREGIIFREIKFLIRSSFNEVHVLFAPACNQVAHRLASECVRLENDNKCVWQESIPDFVTDLLANDLSVVSV